VSAYRRALIIGILGPVLQVIGVVWDLVKHSGLGGGEASEITLRHILFAPEHLVISAGIAVAFLCLPLALQVAAAHRDELDLTLPESIPKGVAVSAPGRTAEVAQ